jgi:hypothetical protein
MKYFEKISINFLFLFKSIFLFIYLNLYSPPVSHKWRVSLLPPISISFLLYTPPIVTSYTSSNLLKQYLLAMDDLPTLLSPKNTILISD